MVRLNECLLPPVCRERRSRGRSGPARSGWLLSWLLVRRLLSRLLIRWLLSRLLVRGLLGWLLVGWLLNLMDHVQQ